MPGTGSDADYVRRAFGPAATALGVTLIALDPQASLVAGHRRCLDQIAQRSGPILVGGVSIGAAVAVAWALENDCAGVWAALPAWSGDPENSPAAWSASTTAAALRTDGLEATLASMEASSPPWLAAELGRSWRSLHPALVDQLGEAAVFRAPEVTDIARLAAPLAVTAATDDPVHPYEVGRAWSAAAPRAALTEVTLDEWGNDPSALGFGCARAWLAIR
ncbi:alpha/beta hydrolase [Gordonia sp. PKS22-38]|uniref:Alpha/beta hydrolase n=1 Tax=Gordonia prachuapensis TaxID=3115651 RepID=A0ABU7MRD2_9ACTN|nr:alpha/beta hydrolase [Gordonia sp. PKS22-38]